jgi:hypothetical protein
MNSCGCSHPPYIIKSAFKFGALVISQGFLLNVFLQSEAKGVILFAV